MEHHFGAVDDTTKRLVGRCVRVPWLKDELEPGDGEAKVARKLLGAEMPGGMASSLSVVEVTTQKERPGVLTGSRQREDQERRESSQKEPQTSHDGDASGGHLDVTAVTAMPGKSPFEEEA